MELLYVFLGILFMDFLVVSICGIYLLLLSTAVKGNQLADKANEKRSLDLELEDCKSDLEFYKHYSTCLENDIRELQKALEEKQNG